MVLMVACQQTIITPLSLNGQQLMLLLFHLLPLITNPTLPPILLQAPIPVKVAMKKWLTRLRVVSLCLVLTSLLKRFVTEEHGIPHKSSFHHPLLPVIQDSFSTKLLL